VQIPETLYHLLPSIYRRRDAETGDILRALLAIIDTERRRIEVDIATLYDDLFIETCEPWAVAYIADLLDVRLPSTDSNPRAYVANAIGFRRRKGVMRTLEELCASITGWPTVAVEFREQLAVAQHVNHPRPERTGFANMRAAVRLAKVGGAFETSPRSAEVRLVDNARGKYGVSNVGLFVWKARDYAISGVRPRPVDPDSTGLSAAELSAEIGVRRYTMHPAGVDIALVNPATEIIHSDRRTHERDVPTRLRRGTLYAELERLRNPGTEGEPRSRDTSADRGAAEYFGSGTPPFAIRVRDGANANDTYKKVPLADLYICNLEGWRPPKFSTSDATDTPEEVATERVVVDPELGRLMLLGDWGASPEVLVDYAYSALADLGGGPYDRQASVDAWLGETGAVDFQIGVSRSRTPGDAEVVETLPEALARWVEFVDKYPAQLSATGSDDDAARPCLGVICIMDNDSYFPDNMDAPIEVSIPNGTRLAIVGGRWPGGPTSPVARRWGNVVGDGVRPHLAANLSVLRPEISASSPLSEREPGGLILDGLLLDGRVDIAAGALSELRISHCTLVPNRGGILVQGPPLAQEPPVTTLLDVSVKYSIVGSLHFSATPAACRVEDSIVSPVLDGPGSGVTYGIDGSWLALSLARSTVLGQTRVERLDAEDTIFYDTVEADRRQEGCVRFCYAPSASQLPRKYRCQPHEALEAARTDAGNLSPNQRLHIEAMLRPRFVSHDWWRAGFGELSERCAPEILGGGEDGSEMGVLNSLHTPQRLANLRAALQEHLRVGIYAGIFFANR